MRHHADVVPRRRLTGTRRQVGTGMGLLALAVAAPLALSACSGHSSSDSESAASAGRAPAPAYAAAGSANSDVQPRAQANGGAAVNNSSANNGVLLPVRSLIITAGLQVKTDDAAAAAQRAQIIVESANGYVAGESIGPGPQPMPATGSGGVQGQPSSSAGPVTLPDVTGSSNTTQALLVLRVPPPSVDPVLSALAGKGSVTYQSRTATDVTGQAADVASRVTSAQAAIAELRALIDKAASMNDLISLEQALAQRESDLESLEAQQKALSDQIQYATITVGYFSQGAPAAPPPVRTGFMRGLTTGWHGFLAVVRGLLAAVGWTLPFVAVVVVLWWPVRRIVRATRRARSRPGTPGAGSAPGPDTSAV